MRRIDQVGERHDFADGFAIPMGLRFKKDRLIVLDITCDYNAGGQELMDRFDVEIAVHD